MGGERKGKWEALRAVLHSKLVTNKKDMIADTR